MAESPSFDEFLADPCGVWAEHAPEIPHGWAVQAARSSRAYREQLKAEISASLETSGSFADADRACSILAETLDAQDKAALFSELARVRPPAQWAAEFGKRFS